MSVPFSMVAMSCRKTAGNCPGFTGASSSSLRFAPSTALLVAMRVKSPVRTLPDGITRLAWFTAAIASSGEIRYCRSLSGFSRTTMVRWLPPKGGGAETPGNVAKIGRTRFNAMSCISLGGRVGLEKINWPTGTLPASNRVMKGGTAPGGMNARARLT